MRTHGTDKPRTEDYGNFLARVMSENQETRRIGVEVK